MAILIHNIDELQKIGSDPDYPADGDYELANNIDASGRNFTPIAVFQGTFNGKGYSIEYLFISSTGNAALFAVIDGVTKGGCAIENLGLTDCNISSLSDDALVAGIGAIVSGDESNKVRISNCFVSGSFAGPDSRIGGIAASISHGEIKNCAVDAEISTDVYDTGLVVGSAHYLKMEYCYSSGSIYSGSSGIGGLVGSGSNLVIRNCHSTAAVVGFFGFGGLVGFVWNSSIVDSYATGSVTCIGEGTNSGAGGGLIGNGDYVEVTSCYASGNVSATKATMAAVGGLIGESTGSTFIQCYALGNVSAYWFAGGFGGSAEGCELNHCHSRGNVAVSYGLGGGFFADIYGSLVNRCCAYGYVITSNVWEDIGGFAAYSGGSEIRNCYAWGSVSAPDGVYIGGFLARAADSTIKNVYSVGAVSNITGAGGLIGWNYNSEIVSSYWDIETSGILVSAGGTGKTTAKMKQLFTFKGWDFFTVPIWHIIENKTYPLLKPVTDLYWISNFSDDWSDASNWAFYSGGVSLGINPADGTFGVVFDGNGQGSCFIDAAVCIRSLRLEQDYSGTVVQQSSLINILGDASFLGGAFSGSGADMSVGGSVYINSQFTATDKNFCVGKNFTFVDSLAASEFRVYTEEILLTPENISNKYILLSYKPQNPQNVTLSIVRGVPQYYGLDFYVTGMYLKWDGRGLDGELQAGDLLRVTYSAEFRSAFDHNRGKLNLSFRNNSFFAGGVRLWDLTVSGDGTNSYLDLHDHAYVENTTLLSGGFFTGTDATLHVRGDLSCESTFGCINEGRRIEIIMDGSRRQSFFYDHAIMPAFGIDQTTAPIVCSGRGPLIIQGDFNIYSGTFNSDGIDIKVGVV